MQKIKVGIAEDQNIFRKGLIHLINGFQTTEVIAEAENGKELLLLMDQTIPDVVILDYQMPGLSGIDTSRLIRDKFRNVKVIILSMFDDEQFVEKAIENGANGYLSKDDDLEEIESAIHGVLENDYYFNDRLSKVFVKSLVSSGKIQPSFSYKDNSFTEQEIEILELIAQEYTTQEIADKLLRSTRTIDKYRTAMMDKSGTKNMIGLVMYGVKHGYITP